MKPRWLALIALLLGTYVTVPAIAARWRRRHCFGLLWCNEQSANSTSTDGLLWLYSAEERGAILGWLSGLSIPWRKIRRTICCVVAFFGHWGLMNVEETRPGLMSFPSIGTLISRARSGPSLSRSI